VHTGDVLADVHARDEAAAANGADEVAACYRIAAKPPEAHPIVLDFLS
jgi:thymidine phosphorylase